MPDTDSFELPEELLIVGAAVKTGLFRMLKERPMSFEELVRRSGYDSRALWIVTEALVALDYLECEHGELKLSMEAKSVFYDPEGEDYVGFSFMHTYNLIEKWLKLPQILMHGGNARDYMQQDDTTGNFIEAMGFYPAKIASRIVEFCLKDVKNPLVLDIGGGPLTFANAFARKGAKVTIIDTPEVVDMMEKKIDPNLDIRMIKGDFRESLPGGEYDVIYMGNICHIYGEEENRLLFREAALRLKPGGRLVINDMIRGNSPDAAVFAVNMLVNTTTGGTWTLEQYKSWLHDAGLAIVSFDEVAENELITAARK